MIPRPAERKSFLKSCCMDSFLTMYSRAKSLQEVPSRFHRMEKLVHFLSTFDRAFWMVSWLLCIQLGLV